jgi:hypothetical protein
MKSKLMPQAVRIVEKRGAVSASEGPCARSLAQTAPRFS